MVEVLCVPWELSRLDEQHHAERMSGTDMLAIWQSCLCITGLSSE